MWKSISKFTLFKKAHSAAGFPDKTCIFLAFTDAQSPFPPASVKKTVTWRWDQWELIPQRQLTGWRAWLLIDSCWEDVAQPEGYVYKNSRRTLSHDEQLFPPTDQIGIKVIAWTPHLTSEWVRLCVCFFSPPFDRMRCCSAFQHLTVYMVPSLM